MSISFQSDSASKIYNRVMQGIWSAETQEKTQSMFEEEAKSDGKEALNEKEAKRIEDLLNRYDKGLLVSLGIKFIKYYNGEEVEAAFEEYNRWKACLDHFYDARGSGAVLLEDFIQDYPSSPHLEEALYRLGHIYSERTNDYDRAIEIFESVVALYPSSRYSSQAQDNLAYLYMTVGDERKALQHLERWLKRPAYTPVTFYCAPRPHEWVKKFNLFTKAFLLLKLKKNRREAENILQKLAENKKNARLANQARGALYEAGIRSSKAGKISDPESLDTYLSWKTEKMYFHAKYLHHEKQDLDKARRIYEEIIEYSEKSNLPFNRMVHLALEELNLRHISMSDKAIAAVRSMRERGILKEFLKVYLNVWHEDDIDKETSLQILLLNECEDVVDTHLILYAGILRFNHEVKCPLNEYMVMFKTADGSWHAISNNGLLGKNYFKFDVQKADEALLKLKKIFPQYNFYSASTKDLPSIYPVSLRCKKEPFQYSFHDYKMDIEKQRSPLISEMLPHLGAELIKDKDSRDKLLSLAKAFSILPKTHFAGIKTIDFRKDSISDCGDKAAACYITEDEKIILPSSRDTTAVHEIVHHWDLNVIKGINGRDMSMGDPSLIFYKISWSRISPFTFDWHLKSDIFNKEDFARKYGRKNGKEDMATFAESYVSGTSDFTRFNAINFTRGRVRAQMNEGNFEPAAKYLFNKYIRSFDPEDGLCFEYKLTSENPPLTLKEVKMKLRTWLSSHPGSVAKTTIEAINETAEVYLRAKEKFESSK